MSITPPDLWRCPVLLILLLQVLMPPCLMVPLKTEEQSQQVFYISESEHVVLCCTVLNCVSLCFTVLHCVALCQPSLYGSRWWRPLQSKRCPDSALAQSFMLTGEGEWSCDMCCDASACYWSTPVHRKEGSLLDISLRPVSVWQHCQLGNQPNVRTPNHLLRLPITKVTRSKL